MANHPSALKRAKQNEKSRMRNKAYRTSVRRSIRQVRQALDAGNVEEAQTALQQAIPAIDKAASKGVLHWKNAARKISRLSKQVNQLSA